MAQQALHNWIWESTVILCLGHSELCTIPSPWCLCALRSLPCWRVNFQPSLRTFKLKQVLIFSALWSVQFSLNSDQSAWTATEKYALSRKLLWNFERLDLSFIFVSSDQIILFLTGWRSFRALFVLFCFFFANFDWRVFCEASWGVVVRGMRGYETDKNCVPWFSWTFKSELGYKCTTCALMTHTWGST